MTPFEKLKAPFDPASVSWRVGSTTKDKSKGLALAYIDARDVMDLLDEAVGPENWQCDYPHAGSKTVCRIGVKIGDEWIWKSNGAGDSDVEAEKGALSDAFKRAAVMFGIGRYLYDLKNTWAELEPYGNSYKIKDSELRRLAGTLPKPSGDVQQPHPQIIPKTPDREPYNKISAGITAISDTGNHDDLKAWWKSHIKTIEAFLPEWNTSIMAEFTAAREAIEARAAKREAA